MGGAGHVATWKLAHATDSPLPPTASRGASGPTSRRYMPYDTEDQRPQGGDSIVRQHDGTR